MRPTKQPLDRETVIQQTAAWSESVENRAEILPTEELKAAWRTWPGGVDELFKEARAYLLMKRGGACVNV